MEDYTKQANDFLEKYGIQFKATFIRNGSMGWDEKGQKRDIYKCEFVNGRKVLIIVEFGQSIAKSTNKKEIPTAYDLLSCITKYNPGKFEDFCSDFGYNEDSIKAEKTWQAVKDEYLEVREFFTDQQLDEIREIN